MHEKLHSFTLPLSLSLPVAIPFKRLIRFYLTKISCPVQSHQNFLPLATPWVFIFDNAYLDSRVRNRGGCGGCWLIPSIKQLGIMKSRSLLTTSYGKEDRVLVFYITDWGTKGYHPNCLVWPSWYFLSSNKLSQGLFSSLLVSDWALLM